MSSKNNATVGNGRGRVLVVKMLDDNRDCDDECEIWSDESCDNCNLCMSVCSTRATAVDWMRSMIEKWEPSFACYDPDPEELAADKALAVQNLRSKVGKFVEGTVDLREIDTFPGPRFVVTEHEIL